MPVQWWASDRATEPAKVSLIPTEQRKIAMGLSGAINPGEVIESGGMEVDVVRWRDTLPVVPTPIVGNLSYDSGTKTAAQEIDASKLPLGEACAMIVTFDVNYGLGIERRSSYLVLVSEI